MTSECTPSAGILPPESGAPQIETGAGQWRFSRIRRGSPIRAYAVSDSPPEGGKRD